jgi:hypothetical protein
MIRPQRQSSRPWPHGGYYATRAEACHPTQTGTQGQLNPIRAGPHTSLSNYRREKNRGHVTNVTVSYPLTDRRDLIYAQLHVLHAEQRDRPFGGDQKQGQAAESVEVGDL